MIHGKDYFGWVFCEGHGKRDGFFRSIKELVEYFAEREIALPQLVKACSARTLSMDADYIIDCALDEHHEDAGECISAAEREELQTFLDEWCARTSVVSYEATDADIILWTITDGVVEDLTK